MQNKAGQFVLQLLVAYTSSLSLEYLVRWSSGFILIVNFVGGVLRAKLSILALGVKAFVFTFNKYLERAMIIAICRNLQVILQVRHPEPRV